MVNTENMRLKHFSFSGKKIEDGDISIYTKMPKLECLDFPSNMHSTDKQAWLVAHLPNVKGYALRPCIEFGDDRVLICGKRKPFWI